MDEPKKRVDIGRIIFFPERWVIQTLQSHVDNVAELARAWDTGLAFRGNIPDMQPTRDKVIAAARIHDMAKPSHFRLQYKQDPIRHQWRWEYSFSGHRFNAFHDDSYTEMLAQLHHEYSVAGITQHVARLRLDQATAAIAENLPLDLYTLEMCDQIEATLACAVMGSNTPEERVFMDFQFRVRVQAEYEIEPFAFNRSPVVFTVEYAELSPPHDSVRRVENAPDDKRRAALFAVEAWLVSVLQTAPRKHQEVKLWPWMR